MFLVDRLAHSNRWSRRHPAEKALLSVGLLVLALILPPWPGAALILGIASVIAVFGAGLPAGSWLRALAWPAGFLAAGAVALPLSVDLSAAGGPTVSLAEEGVRTAMLASGRALAAVSGLLLLTLTTPLADLMWLLRRLGVPAAVAELALLTYRFAWLLAAVASRGRAAQEARLGWSRPVLAVRSAGLLAAALLPRAVARAQRLEVGLAARGFAGELPVARDRLPPRPAVLVATVVGLSAVAGLGVGLGP